MNNYQKPQPQLWTGRFAKTPQYRYQQIRLLDFKLDALDGIDIGLIGYQCDEGVRRNQGRVGAVQGPDALRQQLGKLPVHTNREVADLGNVICENDDMEACQETFSEIAAALIKKGILSVGLGGGHDIAFAHFKGVAKALAGSGRKRIGIINFDAHFDLRPVEDAPNSGTPFYQILNAYKDSDLDVSYLAVGIQQQSNTRELFEIAEKEHVRYIMDHDCTPESFLSIREQLEAFLFSSDFIYLTIDLDGFASAYAPGVSATSPFGLTPDFVRRALALVMQSGKLVAFDVAELNPAHDVDKCTAKLGARLIDAILST